MTEVVQVGHEVKEQVRRFTVYLQGEEAFVADERGLPITWNDYMLVRRALVAGGPHVTELEAEFIRQAVREFCDEATWVFPQSRKELLKKAGPCVYFFRGTGKRTGWVKIGQTIRLRDRTKNVNRQYACETVAFALTPRYLEFERALHQYFREFRHGKDEWFQEDVVLKFLDSFRGLAQ